MRRAIAVCSGCLLVIAAATACGSDANGGGGSGSGQAHALADRAGLESEAVVGAICDGWALDQPDQQTVNEYVNDLLRPLDRVNSPDPPAYTADEIDGLVVEACRVERRSPEAFLDMVRDGLGLSEADLDTLVRSACDRYGVQQDRIASGDWSGEDIAQLIRELAADRGVGLVELQEALSRICS